MFAGVTLGMAGKLIFSGVLTAVTVAATLASALVTTLRAPLFSALFTLVLVQAETAAVNRQRISDCASGTEIGSARV